MEFYVLFNSRGHIGTSPRHYHMWESNPRTGDSQIFVTDSFRFLLLKK